MIVQVYEISSAIEAQQVAQAGVDHIGILVGPGEFPREIDPEDARKILDAVPKSCRRVVLTLSAAIPAVIEIAEQLHPDILHLGTVPDGITPPQIRELKLRFPRISVMRSIPVTGEESIRMAEKYDGIADFLLLDTYTKDDKQIGATGITHDWSISHEIVLAVKTPVILAGGLGAENVAEAIQRVRPAGVDSKTRTDKKGSHEKDIESVKNFVAAAKAASRI